jgi:hypothetical protein
MDSDLRRRVLGLGADRQGVNPLQEQTGIDVERDVDQVIVSVAAGDDHRRPSLALVRGRFDVDRIAQLITEKGGTETSYQKVRIFTHPDANGTVAFIEPELVAVGTADGVRRAIDAKTSGDNIRDNAELMRILRESDEGNAWLVARFDALTGGARLPAELANQLPAISWFSASGYINGGVRGTLRAEARDEAAAEDLRQVIQGFVALARMQTRQRPEFVDLLNSFQLGGAGTTVSLGFSVPSELIETIHRYSAGRIHSTPEQPATPPSEPPPPGTPAL